MADEMILLDTSVLIDYYRKTDKANCFDGLAQQRIPFCHFCGNKI